VIIETNGDDVDAAGLPFVNCRGTVHPLTQTCEKLGYTASRDSKGHSDGEC
jgi:hypothetical protein